MSQVVSQGGFQPAGILETTTNFSTYFFTSVTSLFVTNPKREKERDGAWAREWEK